MPSFPQLSHVLAAVALTRSSKNPPLSHDLLRGFWLCGRPLFPYFLWNPAGGHAECGPLPWPELVSDMPHNAVVRRVNWVWGGTSASSALCVKLTRFGLLPSPCRRFGANQCRRRSLPREHRTALIPGRGTADGEGRLSTGLRISCGRPAALPLPSCFAQLTPHRMA